MRKFIIVWTYIGNYSEKANHVEAPDPITAIKERYHFYREDFFDKARFYIFEPASGDFHEGSLFELETQLNES